MHIFWYSAAITTGSSDMLWGLIHCSCVFLQDQGNMSCRRACLAHQPYVSMHVHVGKPCAGMDPEASYEPDTFDGHVHLKPGTGGSFSPPSALRPGRRRPRLPKLKAPLVQQPAL